MMSRRSRSVMSDALKYELAKELGVADTVDREGWGGVSSRNCGNLVRLAIEKAERALAEEYNRTNPLK
jgi:small acid-soluble spore protein F (minor alpha/beta-type SASP)